jgi:hypothetical protein
MYVTEICLKIAQIKLLYLEISKKKKISKLVSLLSHQNKENILK